MLSYHYYYELIIFKDKFIANLLLLTNFTDFLSERIFKICT